MKRKIVYLRQTAAADLVRLEREKKRLCAMGYQVITFIEGEKAMEQGLYELVKSHCLHCIG